MLSPQSKKTSASSHCLCLLTCNCTQILHLFFNYCKWKILFVSSLWYSQLFCQLNNKVFLFVIISSGLITNSISIMLFFSLQKNFFEAVLHTVSNFIPLIQTYSKHFDLHCSIRNIPEKSFKNFILPNSVCHLI